MVGAALPPLGWRLYGGRRPGPPKGDPVDHLVEELQLDVAQAQEVRAIFERYRPEFDAVERERRERLSALRDRADAELREVLDDAQFARLEERRKQLERHDRGPGGPGGPPPGGPGGRPPPPLGGPR
ncbi:MAG: hypothetical protein R3F62_10375 [Planctomycetota bacterium]